MSDDEVMNAEFEYADWSKETTFLVSGPLPDTKEAKSAHPRGTVRSRREAIVWAIRTFGKRLVHPVEHPHRWCFRIRKIPTPHLETHA